MRTRLNGILTSLAQSYAYPSLQNAPAKTDKARLSYLASSLADKGFLVILADIPDNNFNMLMQAWINHYSRLYHVLTSMLFPMFPGINIGTADGMRPPVVVIQGESTAVIQALAGYVVPYIAMRQHTSSISSAEIIGLMTFILDDLEAEDLSRRDYDELSRQCAAIIGHLMAMPIDHYSLTPMKKALFQENHVSPKQVPDKKSSPAPRPRTSPETGSLNPDIPDKHRAERGKKPDQDKTQKMPIWFNFDDDLESTKSNPSIPFNPLADIEDDDDK